MFHMVAKKRPGIKATKPKRSVRVYFGFESVNFPYVTILKLILSDFVPFNHGLFFNF